MKVVVVESPAKAKTINKYLGQDYTVLASYGHIRDLPAKDGSVRPDDDFSMDWDMDARSEKHVRDIAQALRKSDELILATDPDREGEAISWHVQKVLDERNVLKGKPVSRVVFNEITKSAILEAMRKPRAVDQHLVEAYLARRALDYLVGFTLSPVLWRKLPGSRSAGRVQSVALRLICERESEIESFLAREYWSVDADFLTPRQAKVTASLTRLNGSKLDKFGLPDQETAEAAVRAIEAAAFHVGAIERKQAKRHPYPPFTTSTLQQEASRRLHLPAARTMQIAQRLYEGVDIGGETVGLITYMRTDGVTMAAEAVAATRKLIGADFGPAYLPGAPRLYKTKAKNAQEAHEAIRPTDIFRHPRDVAPYLDRDQLRLYDLIWRRTVACQMESAVLDQVAVDILSQDQAIGLRATGSVVKFDGFLTLYRDEREDKDSSGGEETGDPSDKLLPPMQDGEPMDRQATRPEQHFTQPPPRYSEASLVKALEELGIGRPSTYASIISVLQDRNYVRIDNRRFIPEDRGRVVTAFLENYFNTYVQYNFTAELEDQLDHISDGSRQWKTVLRDFWTAFSAAIDGTKDLRVSQVLDRLDEDLGAHFFPKTEDGSDPRLCPTCGSGRLSLKLGKFGAFIGCSHYPDCRHTRPLSIVGGEQSEDHLEGPKELGTDPASGQSITLRKGPYGVYVQLGDGDPADKKAKPKRVSLYRGLEPAQVTFEIALKLLELPRELGRHPDDGKPVQAAVGRFGPYVKYGTLFKSLSRTDNVLTIGLDRALELIAVAKANAGTELGPHPADGEPVMLGKGRFGPFVSHGKIYANLPKDRTSVTLEEALALLAAKEAKSPAKAGKGKTSKAAAKATDSAASAEAEATPAKPRRTTSKAKAAAAPAAEDASPVSKTTRKSTATPRKKAAAAAADPAAAPAKPARKRKTAEG